MHTIWEINILGGVFMLYGFYFDPTYILIIIGMVICMAASAHVNSTFKKYSRYRSNSGLTGAQAAAKILESQGIYDVQIRHVSGDLTDNYNPSNKVLSLSDATYNSTSVAAIGVAAHECGHAIQDKENYSFLRFRSMLFQIVRISNYFSYIVLLLGFLFEAVNLFSVGIALVTLGLVFQIITLPVEYNASSRAKKELESVNIISPDEMVGVTKVLSSAAMTYVAGVLSNALDLLRLILLFSRRND